MAIQVEVWGDYACFARCELKTERVSYDVMTPSAARGLLDIEDAARRKYSVEMYAV